MVKNLGEEVAEQVAAGDLVIERRGGQIFLHPLVIKLFYCNGRRIPPRGLKAAICNPNPDYYLKQSKVSLVERFTRLVEVWTGGVGMSGADFEKEVALTKAAFEAIELLKPLGEGYPLLLPQIDLTEDYGNGLNTAILPALGRSYRKQFSEREFKNYREDDLKGKVSIIPGSRHDRMVAKVKTGPQAVLYFPDALRDYSVLAQREQLTTLPEQISLAGFETLIACAMDPETMARDGNTPGYDLLALQWLRLSSRSIWRPMMTRRGSTARAISAMRMTSILVV